MRSLHFSWSQIYAIRLAALDLIVISWSVAGAQLLCLLTGFSPLTPSQNSGLFAFLLIPLWFLILTANGSRQQKHFGAGIEEYRIVFLSAAQFLGLAALMSLFLDVSVGLTFLLLTTILGAISLLSSRIVMRKWLVFRRHIESLYCAKVMTFGDMGSNTSMIEALSKARDYGYELVGHFDEATLRAEDSPAEIANEIVQRLRAIGADTLVLAGGSLTTPEVLREIGWHFDQRSENLVLAEELVDVAGPRIETRYVPNLSLVKVSAPTYRGATRFAKRMFDIVFALCFLLLASPTLAALALAVKLSSPGPVFFHQQRVGLGGKLFPMHKFRSMVVNAEDIRASLLDDPSRNTNEILFKMKDDPRVTRVGRFLRRYSLDELPQFFNVLVGEMSIVGPRPPLPEEVLKYEDRVRRRFLVKPGITGLWQVSGRSDLNWRETVRFDLYYVENWSLMQDLQIIWRTISVVFKGEGAY